MKYLDRYVLRQFTGTFVVLIVSLPFLFMITDLTDRLGDYLSRGVPVRNVAISYIYQIPQLVYWGFPIAALIATVFTIGNMTRHQEITAAKAGGVSFYRLTAPLILVSMLLSGVAILVGDIVPIANQKRGEILRVRAQVTTPFRDNVVYQTESGMVIAAARISALESDMRMVAVERETAEGHKIVGTAIGATWFPDVGWVFSDGHLRWISPDSDPETMRFGTLRIPEFTETPEDLVTLAKDDEEMRYAELDRFIRTIERLGGNASEYRVYKAQRISLPLAVFVIVLFGAPLATSSKRGGTAYGVGVSLAVTVVYLMMFRVGEAVGQSGAIHPWVAAWGPNALFFVAALLLYWRVRS